MNDDDVQVGYISDCPKSRMLIHDIASLIEKSQFVAINVDYESPGGSGDTLQA